MPIVNRPLSHYMDNLNKAFTDLKNKVNQAEDHIVLLSDRIKLDDLYTICERKIIQDTKAIFGQNYYSKKYDIKLRPLRDIDKPIELPWRDMGISFHDWKVQFPETHLEWCQKYGKDPSRG